ncbi:MBL fold metallo-hydrolase [candidate division KSB1 bacterium]
MVNQIRKFSRIVFSIFLLLPVVSPAAYAQDSPPADHEKTSQIVLFGSNSAYPFSGRTGPALAVIVGDVPYLVDFGPGIVHQAETAADSGITALRPAKLARAFVTHLHSDNTAGYAELILLPWIKGRDSQLDVYGPPGLNMMTTHLTAAYEEDVNVRLAGEQANKEGYKVNVLEIEPEFEYSDENVKITAFAGHHGIWHFSYGYKFETPDRKIVISGDTAPTQDITKAADGCDVLVHEVYSEKMFASCSEEMQKYYRENHTSSYQLADLANTSEPGLLILYNLPEGTDPEDVLSEIAETYSGKVVVGKCLTVY